MHGIILSQKLTHCFCFVKTIMVNECCGETFEEACLPFSLSLSLSLSLSFFSFSLSFSLCLSLSVSFFLSRSASLLVCLCVNCIVMNILTDILTLMLVQWLLRLPLLRIPHPKSHRWKRGFHHDSILEL